MPLTDFDPAVHGFGFPNSFVNQVVSLPNEVYRLLPGVLRRAIPGGNLETRGRCGGMAYAALDYYHAGRPKQAAAMQVHQQPLPVEPVGVRGNLRAQ